MAETRNIHVVVVGAGFGGLTFCQHFRHPSAQLTVVDRSNHHLFQPLLYQVATAGLSAPNIAQPIRSILSDRPEIRVLLEQAVGFDLSKREVSLTKGSLHYDYLVLAMGGCTSYFGHPEWETFAPGLKTIEDALLIRNRILLAFEKAEDSTDADEREALLTIVIVGGGPTGVELAGAFAELARTVLKRDFRRIDPTRARIILLEASPAVLEHFPPDLAESARRQLEHLGVQVRTSTRVSDIQQGQVKLATGEVIRAANVIWAAGVSAIPLTQKLGVELDRNGRVKVTPDLSVPGHPEVFAIGDLALVLQEDGKPVPGISPAAMQMARHVARIIEHELDTAAPGKASVRASPNSIGDPQDQGSRGRSPSRTGSRPPFKYWDKGTMATIGRSAAVAWLGRFHFSGFFAWLTWLFVHLVFLLGFHNKLAVLLQWTYSYFAYKRGARIITSLSREPARPAELKIYRAEETQPAKHAEQR